MVALSAAARTHAGRNRLSMIGFLPRQWKSREGCFVCSFHHRAAPSGSDSAVRGACRVQASQFRLKRGVGSNHCKRERASVLAAEGATAPETLRHRGPLVVQHSEKRSVLLPPTV